MSDFLTQPQSESNSQIRKSPPQVDSQQFFKDDGPFDAIPETYGQQIAQIKKEIQVQERRINLNTPRTIEALQRLELTSEEVKTMTFQQVAKHIEERENPNELYIEHLMLVLSKLKKVAEKRRWVIHNKEAELFGRFSQSQTDGFAKTSKSWQMRDPLSLATIDSKFFKANKRIERERDQIFIDARDKLLRRKDIEDQKKVQQHNEELYTQFRKIESENKFEKLKLEKEAKQDRLQEIAEAKTKAMKDALIKRKKLLKEQEERLIKLKEQRQAKLDERKRKFEEREKRQKEENKEFWEDQENALKNKIEEDEQFIQQKQQEAENNYIQEQENKIRKKKEQNEDKLKRLELRIKYDQERESYYLKKALESEQRDIKNLENKEKNLKLIRDPSIKKEIPKPMDPAQLEAERKYEEERRLQQRLNVKKEEQKRIRELRQHIKHKQEACLAKAQELRESMIESLRQKNNNKVAKIEKLEQEKHDMYEYQNEIEVQFFPQLADPRLTKEQDLDLKRKKIEKLKEKREQFESVKMIKTSYKQLAEMSYQSSVRANITREELRRKLTQVDITNEEQLKGIMKEYNCDLEELNKKHPVVEMVPRTLRKLTIKKKVNDQKDGMKK